MTDMIRLWMGSCLIVTQCLLGAVTPWLEGLPALTEAEALFARGAYQRSLEAYQGIDVKDEALTAQQQRWILFRRLDSQWRSLSATQQPDQGPLMEVGRSLQRVVDDRDASQGVDAMEAALLESLGDFWWTSRNRRQWNQAWSAYQRALDFWAGSSELEVARDRFLNILWKASAVPQARPYEMYGSAGNYLPVDVLEQATRIARTPEDRSHAYYLLARSLQQRWGVQARSYERILRAFERATDTSTQHAWLDDALAQQAQWLGSQGRAEQREDGQWSFLPDYPAALKVWRRLLDLYGKEETRYHASATRSVEEILKVRADLAVDHAFKPDSRIRLHVRWRNIESFQLKIYSMDLVQDLALTDKGQLGSYQWIRSVENPSQEPIFQEAVETEDLGRHDPGHKEWVLKESLPEGAYLAIASSGGKELSREWILVSNLMVTARASSNRMLVWVCDARNGRPIPHATVRLWQQTRRGREQQWTSFDRQSDAEGLVVMESERADGSSWLITASKDDGQNLTMLHHPGNRRGQQDQWKVYAFSDRPAYRPEETVYWKAIVRQRDESGYITPAQADLKCRIVDPRGATVFESQVTLNAFGSLHGQWEIASDAPLGMYRLELKEKDDQWVANHTLFRVEEYKLPEMKLSFDWPDLEEGQTPEVPRPGDSVSLDLQASYYFGGPVTDAQVQVRVYRRPYQMIFPMPRPYPWMKVADALGRMMPGRQPESLEKEWSVKTDAQGRALITFDSSDDLSTDMSYRVEVRVSDASRREVVAQKEVRVSRQGHFAHIVGDHRVIEPSQKAVFDIHIQDIQERPLSREGQIKVLRKRWREIWISPEGLEVERPGLGADAGQWKDFPPQPERPDQRPWQFKERGYESEVVSNQVLSSDASGKATFVFTPTERGYYTLLWTSQDQRPGGLPGPGAEVRAECDLWVGGPEDQDLGYHSQGLEIILDKETFQVGQTAPVLLSVPTSDRWVLLTLGAEQLLEHRVIHVPGGVRMVPLEITAAHVPNVFVQAWSVSDHKVYQDQESVTVPPTHAFLEVVVEADQEAYAPRQEAEVTIQVRDHAGQPVKGELALAVYDESVTAIQSDLAGDPRETFYGQMRSLIASQGGLARSFVKWLEVEDKGLMTEDQWRRYRELGLSSPADSRLEEGSNLAMSDFSSRGYAEGAAPESMMAVADAAPMQARMMKGAPVAGKAMEMDAAMPAAAPAGGAAEVEMIVRQDMRATAFWEPALQTDQNGEARLKVSLPDTLTTWKFDARCHDQDTRVGRAEATALTRQPLMVRLQTPRFLVVGDRATLSALVHNETDEGVEVSVALEVLSGNLSGWTEEVDRKVQIPAQGKVRVDWSDVRVDQPGNVRLQASARSRSHADAMVVDLVAHEHGLVQRLVASGQGKASSLELSLNLPEQRKAGSTELEIQVTPSLAVSMLDALPYLIDYPYGCTEQTLSRFVPAMIVRRTLEDLGVRAEDVAARSLGGIDPEQMEATHRSGHVGWDEMDAVTQASLERLTDFQHADGGWAWWKEGASDLFMSAYAVWALSLAQDAQVDLPENMLRRGRDFLAARLVQAENRPDLQVWMLHAIHAAGREDLSPKAKEATRKAWEQLWREKDTLNAYGRALLTLVAHHGGLKKEARLLVQQLENGVIRREQGAGSVLASGIRSGDSEPTAHWGEDGLFRHWSDGGVEATAMVLRALLAVDPDNELVTPVVRWLIQNRRGAHWSNTRDTAMVLFALTDYLKQSGELEATMRYELYVNEVLVATESLTPENWLKAPSRFRVPSASIADQNLIKVIRAEGEGTLYLSADASWYSTEEPVSAVGNELFVRRDYARLKEIPTLLKGRVLAREPLADGDSLASGERVEVILTLDASNHQSYLMIEDLKPAGLEAVEVQSGSSIRARRLSQRAVDRLVQEDFPSDPVASGWRWSGQQQPLHQEWRDRQVALFVDELPEGVWEIRYTLRAEAPGAFHALPAVGQAMYIPQIRGNSHDKRFKVTEALE